MNKKIVVIYVLSAIVLVGGGFFSGTAYQKSKVPVLGNGTRSATMGTPPSGMVARNGQPGGNNNSGEITAKDDESITIKLSTGSTKIVYYSDSTKVLKSEDGSKDDLSIGTTISAMGTSNSDGSVSAENIQIQSAK